MEYKKTRDKEFTIDNAMSEISEKYVLNWLRVDSGYPKAYKMDGYVKEGDFYVPELNCMFELKTDLKSKKTKNFFIEVNFNGSPSGILTSKSKYWLLSNGENIWGYHCKELREMHQSKKYDTRMFGGYGNKSTGMILPINLIRENNMRHIIPKDSEAYIDNLKAARKQLTKKIYGLE